VDRPPPTRTERAVAEVLSLVGAVLVLLVVVRIVSWLPVIGQVSPENVFRGSLLAATYPVLRLLDLLLGRIGARWPAPARATVALLLAAGVVAAVLALFLPHPAGTALGTALTVAIMVWLVRSAPQTLMSR
jgi:hypothetical protein